MSVIPIRCPHCGYRREIPADRLPRPNVRATCPRCQGTFAVGEGIVVEPELERIPSGQDQNVALAASVEVPPLVKEPVTASPEEPPLTEERVVEFTFTGNAREYFGIWIVNTLLRIVTLGIYSPWAKVRTRRYFYANTLLGNAPFDYLADPLAILKGWAIAAAFFFLYSFVSKLNPIVSMVFSGLFFLALPWVIVRSRMFHCRNSSHRNIRFMFRRNYGESYAVFAGLPLITPLTLGFIVPFMVYKQKKYLVENTAYGETFFSLDCTAKQFYGIYLRAVALFLGIVAAIVAVNAFFPLQKAITFFLNRIGPNFSAVLGFLSFLLLTLLYLSVAVYLTTAISNLVWNGTRISGHRFFSTLKFVDMLWIMISSAVVIPLSLGLLIPWAKVRMTRYRLEHLSLVAVGDLDAFAAGAGEDISATTEEVGDFFGVDFGI